MSKKSRNPVFSMIFLGTSYSFAFESISESFLLTFDAYDMNMTQFLEKFQILHFFQSNCLKLAIIEPETSSIHKNKAEFMQKFKS